MAGQRWVVDVVEELMLRPERGGRPVTPDVPVLVVEGAHGSGKTRLLGTMEQRVDQVVPWARVDFADLADDLAVPRVLAALAFQLGRSTPVYGELECPRLATGLNVMQMETMPGRREAARAAVVETLGRERDLAAVQDILAKGAGTAIIMVKTVTGLPVPTPSEAARTAAAKRVTDWANARRRPRRVVLGQYQDWYGHQGRGRTNNSLDVLVDLHQWSVNPKVDGNSEKIGALLWGAFLTDIREGFDKARHSNRLLLSALVLLDNADTPLGVKFLNELAAARSAGDAGPRPAPAPLVFVAASGGVLLASVPKEKAGEVEHRERGVLGRLDPVPAWLRLRLADLSDEEIAVSLAEREHRAGDESRLTAMVSGLTGGHPASVQLLVTAMDEHPELCSDLPALLERPATAAEIDPPSVEAKMVRGLLGLGAERRDDPDDRLAAYAAAASRRRGMELSAGRDPLRLGGLTGFSRVDPVLWPTVSGAAPALLRRLLQRCLAMLDVDRLPDVEGLPDPPGIATKWGRVFDQIRRNILPERLADEFPYTEGDKPLTADTAEGLYYALAMGDLGEVATRFDRTVGQGSSAVWLACLDAVARAPRRRRHPAAEALTLTAQAQTLAEQARIPEESIRPTAELVAALWVANDPFAGSRRGILHAYVASHLTDLAARWPQDIEPFYEAAKHHQNAATVWD